MEQTTQEILQLAEKQFKVAKFGYIDSDTVILARTNEAERTKPEVEFESRPSRTGESGTSDRFDCCAESTTLASFSSWFGSTTAIDSRS